MHERIDTPKISNVHCVNATMRGAPPQWKLEKKLHVSFAQFAGNECPSPE